MSTQAKEILNKCHREHCLLMGTTSINTVDFPAVHSVSALAAMQEYSDLEKKELQQEVGQLRRWKREAIEMGEPILEFARKNLDMPLGSSITTNILNRLQEYQQLKERAVNSIRLMESALGWEFATDGRKFNGNHKEVLKTVLDLITLALASWKEDSTDKTT